MTPGLPSWPATLQPLVLVASPRLGLRKYAWQLKMAWDVKNWDRKSNKASRTEQLINVLDFHESKMIHGR
jgi:hypothetical protein